MTERVWFLPFTHHLQFSPTSFLKSIWHSHFLHSVTTHHSRSKESPCTDLLGGYLPLLHRAREIILEALSIVPSNSVCPINSEIASLSPEPFLKFSVNYHHYKGCCWTSINVVLIHVHTGVPDVSGCTIFFVTFTLVSLLLFCETNLLPQLNCTILSELCKKIVLSPFSLIRITKEPVQLL